MSYDIQKQIDNINSSIDCIRKDFPNEYDNKFLRLVEERRKLKVIADTSATNPTIATYGVTHSGKSYLMNCLFQKEGKPFMLETKDRSYNFIEEINPRPKNMDITGVVTRFTSFSNNPSLYSEDYPILMRCLSVPDILMILSDVYYNDVYDYNPPDEKEIKDKTEYIYSKYRNAQPNPDSPIQPDDMLTMEHYFRQHINNAQSFIKSDFFIKVALVADRIPSNDWLDVFQILWNRSPYQTKLFTKMNNTLARLKYAKYVYLPPEALLHNGINEDTVMSVQCLNELFDSQNNFFTDVYLRSGNSYTKLTGISKSEVCAICAEIIIKIGNDLLENVRKYDLATISDDSRSRLGSSEVEMTIFRNNDMLDFPGVSVKIKKELETLESDILLTNVFLSGKVAYLFNKYNEEKKINILLYCHHGEKNEVIEIPHLLGDWIKNNIGDTMEKRRVTIERTANISPLFYIGTMFNMDMEFNAEAIANNEDSLKERWTARFKKVLYKECFNVEGNLDAEKKRIFSNWTAPGESFTNSYILRDYKYSGPLASKLYDLENTPEARMTLGKEFYELMRRTFIESEHVKQFFKNPELAWDVCATMNNDGSLYIIQNLTKIAETMRKARQTQFDEICQISEKNITDLMSRAQYSHNDNRNPLVTDFKMSYNIQKQIDNINSSIDWICKNRPNDYDTKFLELVEERRKLKVIADASETNPAIAAYGVSQVGKSYLMNCMLQKDGKPFMLETKDKSYNFIEEMNPKTKNTEATGVVTRFTSFSNNPSLYSKEYPILMRCLSVTDILLILSDGYYNDVYDFSSPSEKEIEEKAEFIYNKYRDTEPNPDSPLQSDDLLTMKHYFKNHINNAQAFIKSDFFNKVALVADRIPSNDWLDVFQILWNRSPAQTKLFNKMINTLAQLRYAKYVYLPPQALLHNGINENTVISVQCLNELFNPETNFFTDVYLRSGDSYTKLTGLSKSEICAVCTEIIVKIGNDLLENVGKYYLDSMSDDSRSRLGSSEVAMTIFRNNDMLDFPGARSRIREERETLESSNLLLTNVYLRGKVAYLFNKYNEEKKINILLYCHHADKNEVNEIPHLLGDWIKNNMGDTIEKRRITVGRTANISPLFYIGTKFNIDMEYNAEDIANNENSLKERWNARFKKVLYKECFNVEGNLDVEKKRIFSNWTAPGESFTNSYILRDYKYSGPLASKLYDLENTPEARMTLKKEFYELMRRTFIESEHVKQFFKNPELAWDVCATMNNDGSLYIIQKLTKIAETMCQARKAQFEETCIEAIRSVINSIKDYFISTDADEILKKNIRQANSIFRELEFACQSEPEYFGHLLQALQLSEAMSFKQVHDLIPTLTSTVSGDNIIKDYELIHKRCDNFKGCKNDDEKWDRLIETYRFADRAECEEFLKRHKVDSSKLFAGDYVKRKNSAVIAHSLMNDWRKAITSVQFMTTFTDSSSIDQSTMNNLVNCLISTAEAINLKDSITSQIKEYADILNPSNINEDLVADIIATTISDFVTNFGYNFLSDSQKEAAKRLAEENRLPTFDWISRERKEHYPEEDMTALFNSILESSDRFTPSYEANYNAWLEYMYIAFIAHINVPEFDREANDRLKVLLDLLRA